MKKRIYVDIDGVLLTKRNQKIPAFGVAFVDFITHYFDCYWLTTHCKGEAQTAVKYLSSFYEESSLTKLRTVKATDWETLKTEGIDFSSDFYWLEDAPFESEKAQLKEKHRLDRLLLVDLNQINELERVKRQLQQLDNLPNHNLALE